MNPKRLRELELNDDAKLTLEEMKEGWHWCNEFDYLCTQGEIMTSVDPPICLCGFDRRLVTE